jgi:putative transposase
MGTRGQVMNALDALLSAGVRIDNVQQWCRQNGVTARTFYRHKARIGAEGVWRERSRRPQHSPGAACPDLDAWICKLRTDLGIDNGADHIRDALTGLAATTRPAWAVPSRSTINRVLARHDLLAKNPAKRPRSSWRRFCYARPRDCYQIDATLVALTSGRLVAVFDVLDDCTRMLVACRAAPAETTTAAITAITDAFEQHGRPAIVLSDNGLAFTNRLRKPGTGVSRFTRTVRQGGTRLIHSSPYHPQTCGKVERHHQTLKRWLRAQPRQPHTLRQLQRLLDTYREHYNHRRHSALPHRATPHQAWTTAPAHGGPHALPRQTDATVHHPRVAENGTIKVGTTNIGIGRRHHGQAFTVICDHHHATVYTTDGSPVGHAELTTGKRGYAALIPTTPPD